MKTVLCVCQGGNVRSAAFAYCLKARGYDAVAVGVQWNSPETIAKLIDWADLVVVTEARLVEYLPETAAGKLRVLNVGPDRWGTPMHPELLTMAGEFANSLPPGPRSDWDWAVSA